MRVVAATNKKLEDEVKAGRFREDLYFRLNVVPILAPSLRRRPEDIPYLAAVFLKEYCDENGMPLKSLDEEVIRLMKQYEWPGNVRELRNQVERLVIMSPGRTVRVGDLSAEIRMAKVTASPSAAVGEEGGVSSADEPYEGELGAAAGSALEKLTLQDAKRQFERDMILKALHRHGWNVSRAAEELGLERTNLHKKIKQLDLARKSK